MFPGPALRLLARLDRRLIWRLPAVGNKVFPTFDDGPDPQVTPWVLDTLAAHGAQATFFCTGRQAERHPALMDRIRREGHAVGHHTWSHADGWRTSTLAWQRDVLRAAGHIGGELFRPPYGHLPLGQTRPLCKRFRVVMWDVMGYDFKPGRSGEACARHVLGQVRPGSIIVLHDNAKSATCLRGALPTILAGLRTKGLQPAPLDDGVTDRSQR